MAYQPLLTPCSQGVAAMAGLDFSVRESLFLIGRSEAAPNMEADPDRPLAGPRPFQFCWIRLTTFACQNIMSDSQ